MKIFARGMKWTGLFIMVGIAFLSAKNADKINELVAKIPVIGDSANV